MEQTIDGGVEPTRLGAGRPSAVQRADEMLSSASQGMKDWLPEGWLEPSVWGLQRWQWVALPVLAALTLLLTLVLVYLTTAAVRRLRKDKASADRINERLTAPLRLAWAAILFRLGMPLVGLSALAEARWETGLRVALELAVFWGALRAATSWSDHFPQSQFAQTHPGARALVSLLSGVLRIALLGFAVLTALAELGYSVTSVLAGLGIGGIALALGAQKTLENVFGAFALAVDQPIREGDFVRVGELMGTVENIGLRSTRIRTLERTVVAIPNGKLAELQLETFAARDRVRLLMTLSLRYDTTRAQLDQVLTGVRAALTGEPKLFPEGCQVNLTGLGPSGLDVEVQAFIGTTDFDEFRRVREGLLLQFLSIIEGAGTSLAYPTQTLQLERARK